MTGTSLECDVSHVEGFHSVDSLVLFLFTYIKGLAKNTCFISVLYKTEKRLRENRFTLCIGVSSHLCCGYHYDYGLLELGIIEIIKMYGKWFMVKFSIVLLLAIVRCMYIGLPKRASRCKIKKKMERKSLYC